MLSHRRQKIEREREREREKTSGTMKQLLFERGDINSRSFFDGENFHELTEIIGGLDRFDLRLPIVNDGTFSRELIQFDDRWPI